MCQAIRDGGRRCSVHQHNTIAAVSAVTQANEYLTKYQVERMFTELRRESPAELTESQSAAFETLRNQYTEELNLPEDIQAEITRQFEKSDQHEADQITDSSKYAVINLRERASRLNAEMEVHLQKIADRTGYTLDEVKAKYFNDMKNVDTSRGSIPPAEYTRRNRDMFHEAGLPSDRSSVTTLIRMASWNPGEKREGNRVELKECDPRSRIAAIGAHEDRLEIRLRRGEGMSNIKAYRNVPESVTERLLASPNPTALFISEVANNDDYKYPSQRAAEEDNFSYRCVNCGQFRALNRHNCPKFGDREQLISNSPNLTSDEVNALMKAEWNEGASPTDVTAQTSDVQNVSRFTDSEALPLQTEAFTEREEQTFVFENLKYVSRDSVVGKEQSNISESLDHALSKTNIGASVLPIPFEGKTYLRFSMPNNMRIEPEEDKQAMAEFFRAANGADKKGAVLLGRNSERKIVVLAMYITEDFYLTFDTPDKHNDENPKTAFLNAVTHTFDETHQGTETQDGALMTKWEELGARKIDNAEPDNSSMTVSDSVNAIYVKAPLWDQVNAAINESGETVTTSLDIKTGTSTRSIRGGTAYGTIETSYDLHAELAFNRSETGELQILDRQIRCTCPAYQERYYCAHVSQTEYDLNTIIHSKVNPSGGEEAEQIASLMNNRERVRYSQETDSYVIQASEARLVTSLELSTDELQQSRESMRELIESAPEELNRNQMKLLNYAAGRDSLPISGNFRSIKNKSLVASDSVELLQHSQVRFPTNFEYTSASDRNQTSTVSGHIIFDKGSTKENPIVLDRSLKCTCVDYQNNYDCEHVRDVTENRISQMIPSDPDDLKLADREEIAALNSRYDAQIHLDTQIRSRIGSGASDEEYSAERERIAEQVALERRREEQRAERERAYLEGYRTYHAERDEVWANADEPMAANMPAFHENISDLTRRRERGETILEMQYENVTNGICGTGDGARGFGIEIEFTVGDDDSLRAIGRELYEAGLTETSYQQGYGSSRGVWDRWSFEEDCTVDAEIVSPIMKDTPENWRELEQVIEIVNRNGGRASTRAGSHIHISSGSYGTSTAKHAELLRLARENEDTLFRLASNPGRGTHRGNNWCNPNIRTVESDIPFDSAARVRGDSTFHGDMVNTGGSRNGHSSHIEFRMWDASLNAAVIQQQVAFTAAFTDLAERQVIANEGYVVSNRPALRPIGTSWNQFQNTSPSEMTEEQFAESHTHYAELFDRLFSTTEQREQAVRLLAMTKNQH